MNRRRPGMLVIVMLMLAFFLAACGDEEDDTTVGDEATTATDTSANTAAEDITATDAEPAGGADLTGTWSLVTENGSPPAALGYNSTILTLDDETFSSEYDGSAGVCTWSGTYTSTPTSMTWTADAASGPPCDQALGQTRTAQVSLSADGDTLTLDWTATPMGTLQVYERAS